MINNHREHIQKIREDFQASQRVKDSLNNSIRALARDLYSKDTHFIFELIQNAEDNTYKAVEPSLSFRLSQSDPTLTEGSNGALIIQNNEIGFSLENVEAICAVGKTTKNKMQGYIGEKGIGFKSVFRVTSNPHIYSNGYSFCLPEFDEETGLGYIVPQWIEELPDRLDRSCTTIILPLNKASFGYVEIETMLRDIEPASILFLSKLKEIKIETDTGDDLNILKDTSKRPVVQILVEGKSQNESISDIEEFLLCTQPFNRPKDVIQEKREEIKDREVSIAFLLNKDHESIGKIFAYLPVRSDTGLPFLINADFILPSSREDIQDVPWNRWLMKCVAELVAIALPLLKERGLLTVGFLEMLTGRMNDLAEDMDNLYYPIFVEIREALKTKDLIPADDGTFVSAQNAKLARGSDLRKLLTHDQLTLLFKSEGTITWLTGDITEFNTPNLRRYLLEHLKVEEVRPEKFVELLTDVFLKNQTDNWIIDFYSFLGKNRTDLWKKPDTILKKKTFIRLENNTHVVPFKTDGTPNAYLPSSITTNFPTVKRNIVDVETAADFLKQLGIIKPDLFAEIIEFILPKYTKDKIIIDFDENIDDLTKIKKVLNEPHQDSSPSLIAKLRILLGKLGFAKLEDYFSSNDKLGKIIPVLLKLVLPNIPFLRASNGLKTEYKSPKVIYISTPELRHYFQDGFEAWFIADDYPEELLSLFQELGVNESPVLRKRSVDKNGFVIISNSHSSHRRGLNGFDPDIQVEGLSHALAVPSSEKSAFVWKSIAIANAACIRGIVEKSSRQTYENSRKEECVSESFGHLLMGSKWLPSSDGQFHHPAELSLNDLPEQFERDEKLADLLGMKKDVVSRLAEEAGVKPETLELARILEQNPDMLEYVQRRISEKKEKPMFPARAVTNPERRQERLEEQFIDAPNKEYEKRERSVRITRGVVDPSLWLREQYTNEVGQIVCQICKEEMPFKKRDGKYYFEAVEALSKDHFPLEHEAQFLALCPLCAAMYKEFIKNDEGAMTNLKTAMLNTDQLEIPLRLGEIDRTIRFVETHYHDIKTILKNDVL